MQPLTSCLGVPSLSFLIALNWALGWRGTSSHEILISSKLFWWIIWFVLSHFQNAVYTQAVTARLPNEFFKRRKGKSFSHQSCFVRQAKTCSETSSALCPWDPPLAASVCVAFCSPPSSPMPNQGVSLGCVLPQLKTNGTIKSPLFFRIKKS